MHIHGKNGGTATDIENDLVLEDVLVLDNGLHIRLGANFIFLFGWLGYRCPLSWGHSAKTWWGRGNSPTSPRGCLYK